MIQPINTSSSASADEQTPPQRARRFLITRPVVIVSLLIVSGMTAAFYYPPTPDTMWAWEAIYALIVLPPVVAVGLIVMAPHLVVEPARNELWVVGSWGNQQSLISFDRVCAVVSTDAWCENEVGAGYPAGVYVVATDELDPLDSRGGPPIDFVDQLVATIQQHAARAMAPWSPDRPAARHTERIHELLTSGRWQFCYRGHAKTRVASYLGRIIGVPVVHTRLPVRLDGFGALDEDRVPEPLEPPASPVRIARFDNPMEYQLARARLAAEGIRVAGEDLLTTSVDWTLMNALGQIKLSVGQPDMERAIQVLRDSPARGRLINHGVDGLSPFATPVMDPDPDERPEPLPAMSADSIEADVTPDGFDVCPRCGSEQTVIHHSRGKRLMLLLWLFGSFLPIWFGRTERLRCRECGKVFDPPADVD